MNDEQIDAAARKLLVAVRREADDVSAGRLGNVDFHIAEILDVVASPNGDRIVARLLQLRAEGA